MKIPSALWAIIGSVITTIPIITGQFFGQFYEDKRHLQSLAYQYAWQEWKALLEEGDKGHLMPAKIPPFRAKLMEHLIYAAMLADADLDDFAKGKGMGLFNAFIDEYFDRRNRSSTKEHPNQDKNSADNHTKNGIKSR